MKKLVKNRLKIVFLFLPYLFINLFWRGMCGGLEFVKDCWELWHRDF